MGMSRLTENKSNLECKAWLLKFKRCPTTLIIRSDITRSKARYKEWSLLKRWYKGTLIGDIQVVRAPKYDHLAVKAEMLGGTQEGVSWGCLAAQ